MEILYIIGIQVGKKQLRPILEKMANIASFGYYEGKKQILGIDKYFHLYLILYLDNDKMPIVLEKNHRVGWKPYHNPSNDEEMMINVHMNKPIKLITFIENGEHNIQPDRLYIYDAVSNNCQTYVKDMLQSNKLWDKSLEKFVIQDVKSAIPNDLQKVTKGITDLAHRINYAFVGGKEIKKQQLKRRLNRRRKIKFIL